MKNVYRRPQVEEGKHNVVLQSRAGNRLTLMAHESTTQLEWVYKPNAFRRKDLRARNFSGRDNQTELFEHCEFPEIGADIIRDFEYDPFTTRLHVDIPESVKNVITVVNVIDENCFALAADRPLTITFRPHHTFEERDGLLTETFTDRGEEIVSFISFASFEENRYRVLDDGTAVIQIYENETVLIGGEENAAQVERVLRKLRPLSLNELLERNEQAISAVTEKGRVQCDDENWQRVLDLNRRVIYSGLDAGGACFGALNRIYYLIWNRDGAMTTSMAARAGNPDLLKAWAPFIFENPAMRRAANGERMPEWLQILGSRWTKSEDDGIFYVALSLFTLWQTTGESDFTRTPQWTQLLTALDFDIATRFDENENLFGSDTRGETTLKGSPTYGYDMVNGKLERHLNPVEAEGGVFERVYSLYHNVNLFNTLLMIASLQAEVQPDDARIARYTELSEKLRTTLSTRFVNEDGFYRADRVRFADGSMGWMEFPHADYWEYAWAVSVGPFFPDWNIALRSARMVREVWPTIRNYGYCPWNTVSRFLKENGMDTATYREMLQPEVDEALAESVKFPLRGALTEYFEDVEGWRGLPFSAGTFMFTLSSLLLQSLPCGLAVRASDMVSETRDFRFRTSRIDAMASGQGDVVQSWTINGQAVEGTLQIPENLLRNGANNIEVQRGVSFEKLRLHSSSATLRRIEATSSTRSATYYFYSAIPCELIFDNYAQATTVKVRNADETEIACQPVNVEGTEKTLIRIASRGDFTVSVELST